jgi:hypothetical protein
LIFSLNRYGKIKKEELPKNKSLYLKSKDKINIVSNMGMIEYIRDENVFKSLYEDLPQFNVKKINFKNVGEQEVLIMEKESYKKQRYFFEKNDLIKRKKHDEYFVKFTEEAPTFVEVLDKLNHDINIPFDLDLKELAVEDYTGNSRSSLNSFIVQSGSLRAGHYTAYVKINNKWYLCNDSCIKEQSNKEVEKALKQAYIVIFENF